MIQKHLQKLLTKEMNRREFIAHMGAGILAIVGISGLIKSLSEFGTTKQHNLSGYGSSSYGGRKKLNRSL